MKPMSRRSALRKVATTSAVATTAAALGSRLVAADAVSGAKGRINHSVCKWCYPKVSLDDLCKAGQEFGLKSVELLEVKDFPTLKFVIPHGGGAVPYHWGRYRGIAQDMGRPPLKELLLDNIYFDTCVYHQPGIDLLLKVIPAENILFASEMVGAVRGIDPESGHHYDDTKRYIDAIGWISEADRQKIFNGNASRVYSRLGARNA